LLLIDIGEATGMMADDVIATLVSLDMITELNSRFVSLDIVYTHKPILWPFVRLVS